MDIQDRDGSDRLLSLPGSSGREEVTGFGSGSEVYGRPVGKGSRCYIPAVRKAGGEIMTAFLRTTKEWWLTAVCLLLLMSQVFPTTLEWVYPILDFKGGNQFNMEIRKNVYHCGEMVEARFKMQKQRDVTGQIKWQLVSNHDNRNVILYSSRKAASPALIVDHWCQVEELPEICQPGRYYFEGTITYPILMGNIAYGIKTQSFEVVP